MTTYYSNFGIKSTAILAAGGLGSRLGVETPKQFMEIKGRPMMAYSLDALSAVEEIGAIVVTYPPGFKPAVEEIARLYPKVAMLVPGGATRQESVYRAAMEKPSKAASLILIHDAARPFVTPAGIRRAIQAAADGSCEGCSLGVPVKDTIKICGEGCYVASTPDRGSLWQIQTPQAFVGSALRAAHEKAKLEGYAATDDAGLVERYGGRVRVIMGDYSNIKITTKEDLMYLSPSINPGG